MSDTRGKTRRAEWLLDNPCSCGNPSKYMRASVGKIPNSWTCSDEQLRKAFDKIMVDYFCDSCRAAQTAKSRQRIREQEYTKQRTARLIAVAKHKCKCGATATVRRGIN